MAVLIVWTVAADLWLGHQWTTSQVLHRTCSDHPAVALGLGAFSFAVMRDALPRVWWWLLLLALGAAFGLGHCLWPLR